MASEATDMRCGFDRLAERVKAVIGENAQSGHLFVFRSRRGDRLKILVWERDGFVLRYKQLDAGVFKLPRVEHGAPLRSLLRERDSEKQRAEEQSKRADELYLENLRLQMELARYKKWTYGPRADRLSASELAQLLLKFAEELEQKPIHSDDLPLAEQEPELRRVKRRKGRRALANFENLPVSTQVDSSRSCWRIFNPLAEAWQPRTAEVLFSAGFEGVRLTVEG
jgi:transposase